MNEIIVAMRGRNPDNPSDRTVGGYLEQRLEPNTEGICNCLTSVQKDNLVMEIKNPLKGISGYGWHFEQNVYSDNSIVRGLKSSEGSGNIPKVIQSKTVKIKQATKQGYIECEVGGVADLSFPDSATRRGRVIDKGNTCPTIQTESEICKIESHYAIRKLTPKECFRLMDFDDKDYEAAAEVNTNTQLYKQAGNSIVVAVLENIFREML